MASENDGEQSHSGFCGQILARQFVSHLGLLQSHAIRTQTIAGSRYKTFLPEKFSVAFGPIKLREKRSE